VLFWKILKSNSKSELEPVSKKNLSFSIPKEIDLPQKIFENGLKILSHKMSN
jgi:hypothetical protein